jgi:hypothetical protein
MYVSGIVVANMDDACDSASLSATAFVPPGATWRLYNPGGFTSILSLGGSATTANT